MQSEVSLKGVQELIEKLAGKFFEEDVVVLPATVVQHATAKNNDSTQKGLIFYCLQLNVLVVTVT